MLCGVAQAPPVDREGIVQRLREGVLRRQPVVDVDDDAVGRGGQGRADGLELVGAQQHEPAAVEVDQHRQWLVRPARRVDEARDVAVRSGHRHRVDAGHLDERRAQRPVTCARPGADLLERRRLVRLGLRGHGVEHRLDLWVELGHAGAACRGAGARTGLGGAPCVDSETTARNSARTADSCPQPVAKAGDVRGRRTDGAEPRPRPVRRNGRMRAAITVGPRSIDLVERPDPRDPRPGQTLLQVEVVGVCGSDLHFFCNDLGPAHARLYPVVQGHEFSAVVAAVDPAGSPFEVGERVAVWPVNGCGRCGPCTSHRPNVCRDLELVGVHRDGALQDYLAVETANVVRAADLGATRTALVEPVSIAVHTVARGRGGRRRAGGGVRRGPDRLRHRHRGAGPGGHRRRRRSAGLPPRPRRPRRVRGRCHRRRLARAPPRRGRSPRGHRHHRSTRGAADCPRPRQQRRRASSWSD